MNTGENCSVKAIALVCILSLLAVLFIMHSIILPEDSNTLNFKKSNASYYAELSPCGRVYFRETPNAIITIDDNYNDMLIAMNEEKNIKASGFRSNMYTGFYKSIGIIPSIDKQKIRWLGGNGSFLSDAEGLFYLKAESGEDSQMILHVDPYQIMGKGVWNERLIESVKTQVGPFFANRYSRDGIPPVENYEIYSLYELSKRVADAYKRRGVIEKLEEITNRMTEEIQVKLPPENKRPKVALVTLSNGKWTLYSLDSTGFGQAQYKAVGAVDAFKGLNFTRYNGKNPGQTDRSSLSLDLEGLLSVNPDVIILNFGVYGIENEDHFTAVAMKELLKLKDDPIGKNINAIKNGRIYPGGTPLQGPLNHIFQIEMAAKQIYPEIFGKWKEDADYPVNEQLFDRNELKKVLNR